MGQLVFQANLGGAVNLAGPNTASTVTFTLPSADGTNGQSLVTNGSGTLSFATPTPNVSSVTGTLPVANGGTGLTSTPVNGALDIGNGTGFTRTTLTAGSGITITNSAGGISIATSGGSGGMTLLATLTPATGVTSIDATSLASSKQIVIVTDGNGIATTASVNLRVAISSDNGTTFGTARPFTSANLSPYGVAMIYTTNIAGTGKVQLGISAGALVVIGNELVVTGVINAVRILITSGTFSGVGSIYVYGMN